MEQAPVELGPAAAVEGAPVPVEGAPVVVGAAAELEQGAGVVLKVAAP